MWVITLILLGFIALLVWLKAQVRKLPDEYPSRRPVGQQEAEDEKKARVVEPKKDEVKKSSGPKHWFSNSIWTILVIFAVVGLFIFVIWLWQNNRGPKELSTPDCSTYYDLKIEELDVDEEAVRKVTVCDDWLPLATVMPTWYSKKGDLERKFFDTDQYVVLMRINKGEPFKFSTGSGMEQGKRSYSIDEYLAAEVMMDPNGLHPVGFVTFRLKR